MVRDPLNKVLGSVPKLICETNLPNLSQPRVSLGFQGLVRESVVKIDCVQGNPQDHQDENGYNSCAVLALGAVDQNWETGWVEEAF